MKFLFVCLGNICRSPTAEGVFRFKIKQLGWDSHVKADSAGTSAHHEGDPADGRSQEHARLRGYDLTSLSRPLKPEDFINFDMILVMDDNNLFDVLRMAGDDEGYKSKVHKLTDFCTIHNVDKVPDPYYRGDDGFEVVLDIIEDACDGLIEMLKKKQAENPGSSF